MKNHSTTAFILAGGRSSRFKQDKSLFPYQDKPLIQHAYDILKQLFETIAIIGSEGDKYDFLKIDTYPDVIPGFGPLGGIYTALHHLLGEWAFMFPCDMPNLNTGLISYMLSLEGDHDIIIPRNNEYYEPLHAIYSIRCMEPIRKTINAGNKKITGFFAHMRIREVNDNEVRRFGDPDRLFMNINYPDDIEE